MLKQNLQLMQIGSRHLIGVFSMINFLPLKIRTIVSVVVSEGCSPSAALDVTEVIDFDQVLTVLTMWAVTHV